MPKSSIERAIAALSPRWAVRRAQARQVLAYYEAATPDRTRKGRRETSAGNDTVLRAGTSLREQARHLDQNHDLAIGVLNALVNFTIGPVGIGIEPQPMNAAGDIDDAFARELAALWDDFCRNPEVTWQHDWGSACRLLALTWFRDGEAFAQILEGNVAYLDHGTRVPLSIEMIEPDFIPMTLHSSAPTVVQGIEINAWGRPVAYNVYKTDPRGSLGGSTLLSTNNMKRIEASRMLHVANRRRIRQLRGVSVFASVLGRLDDLKDYEESERVAAKVAASMAAFITKGQPDMYEGASDAEQRQIKFRPGMVFDDLRVGESIGTIDTNRPNPNLETYRSGQLRAVAAGTGPTYSSVARTYNGTYSSQRQELVEGWTTYAILQSEFIARMARPIYERFVAVAIASGKLRVPRGIKPGTENDALYLAPEMPWIDPESEAKAWAVLEDRAYSSGPEIIRKRGGSPMRVLDQEARWLKAKDDKGIPPPPLPGGGAHLPPAPTPAAPAKADGDAASAAMGAAMTTLGAAMTAMAGREPATPHVTVQAGDVHIAPTEVHNHLPEPAVTVEAIMPAPAAPHVDVHVNAVMPEQAAPQVTVQNTVQPAPIGEMRIVAMPDRETTTSVVRDKRDNIVTTTQTEKDA